MAVDYEEARIIKNPEVLEENHLPERLLNGEDKAAEIEIYLSPILKKQRPLHLWLYGDPGTGKTATARYVLEKMQRESGIKGLYVNCWQHDSLYSILDYITAELRILRAEEQRTARKLEKFQQYIKDEAFLLILDEIDKPSPQERSSIVYTFCCLPKVGLMNISNSFNPLFELDARVKSRLNPRPVVFKAYTHEELVAILTERAQEALVKDSYKPETISRIAELADGDARMAVQTLKNAAWLAEGERATRISETHVRKAWGPTREIKIREQLSSLTTDHKILYNIVKYQGEILSNDLRQLYLLECSRSKRRPIAERTFSDYINDLKRAGLAQLERARVRGKVRLIKAVK